LQGFRPQTQREAALLQMIVQLQNEVAALRREVQGRSAVEGPVARPSEGAEIRGTVSAAEGEGGAFVLPANWRNTSGGRVFKAYDKNGDEVVTLDEWLAMTNGNTNATRRDIQTKRFNEAEPGGDGEFTPAEFVHWYSIGQNEGTKKPASTRDGEGGPRGPRDGDGPKAGPRDGDTPKAGPRDGDNPKTGPRDGDRP
ncbi:MAG: hypothetical protein B7Z55_11970, partial [Planctomycetales bacterium 12-60-4]